jgi:hypothetical protein
MTHHADKAFSEPVQEIPVAREPKRCRCRLTDRDTMLDAQLQKALRELRSAEDELAVWRGLSAELTALRGLRSVVFRELSNPDGVDIATLQRAVIMSDPTGTTNT